MACEAEYFGLTELSEELREDLCAPLPSHKEVLVYAIGLYPGVGNRLFAFKVPANQSVWLSNLFNDELQVGQLR